MPKAGKRERGRRPALHKQGTDDLYLNYLAHFVRPGGQIGSVGAGLVQEVEKEVPDHFRALWTQGAWCLHSAAWWRHHWERTGLVAIEAADTMENGWELWLQWQRTVLPDNAIEMSALSADRGRYLGYVRVVGRRQGEVALEEYCWPDTLRSAPIEYEKVPLLREE